MVHSIFKTRILGSNMAIELSDTSIEFISGWKFSDRDNVPDKEELDTYFDDFTDIDDDVMDLLRYNIVRLFNSLEKGREGDVPSASSCPMDSTEFERRSHSKRKPHAFMLSFQSRDTDLQSRLDSLRDADSKEDVVSGTEELVDRYRNDQNYDTQAVVFSLKIKIDSIESDFVCVFITGISDRKYTAASENEVVQRVKESFDDEIPKRMVYPFYDLSDEDYLSDTVKIWEEGGSLKNYYVDAFELVEPQSTDEVIFGDLETERTYEPSELIERGQENGLSREQAENTTMSLKIAGKKLELTLEDLRDEKVKIYRSNEGKHHLIVSGELELSEEQEDEISSIDGLFIEEEDELSEHFS